MAIYRRSELVDPTISIVGKDLTEKGGLTLTAVMHNEMYFLEDFLAHYRNLGVERFVILDDHSKDGSFEYANEQPDVMLLRSEHRYGDKLPYKDKKRKRAIIAWRHMLASRFGDQRWSIQVDLDEFIELPEGTSFPNLLSQLKPKPSVIWASMIDMYPEYWSDIVKPEPPKLGDIQWYFDARKHIKPRRILFSTPATVYSGVRARLRDEFQLSNNQETKLQALERKFEGNPYPRMGRHYKPAVMFWDKSFSFSGSHVVHGARALDIVLPMGHFKFAPNFVSRVEYAIKSKSYADESQSYRELNKLYEVMVAQNASFIGEDSKPYAGYQGFYDAGIAVGLNPDGTLE